MNYEKHYKLLIEKAKHRILDCYSEKHHIIPRCIGGNDNSANLVRLTPEEHYLAHQLLVKIYPNNFALVKAASMMIPKRPSNKLYGWLRRRLSAVRSIEQCGSNNNQYGTCWIYHELFGSKKIDKKLLPHFIDQGWYQGRNLKKCKINVKPLKRNANFNSQVQLYREYYLIYSKVGFEKFVQITGYKYSKPNLVQRFAKLLPEFIPQNGKKRR